MPELQSIRKKCVLVVDDNLIGTRPEHIARAKDLFIQGVQMLKNTGDPMDAMELAKQAKKQNIIDMAVGLTTEMGLFQGRSVDLVKEKLADLFEGLDRIGSEQDFSKIHRDFCQWFVQTIRLAKTEEAPSFGHAAKVLDFALKVYVYYCNMPCPEKAESLLPRLNGAIDTPILHHLFKKLEVIYGKSHSRDSWTIKMVDKETYDLLQKVIRQDVRDSFDDNISPVQYDDIMGWSLNRRGESG